MFKKLMATSMVVAKAVLLAVFANHAVMNQDLSLNTTESDAQYWPFPDDWGGS